MEGLAWIRVQELEPCTEGGMELIKYLLSDGPRLVFCPDA